MSALGDLLAGINVTFTETRFETDNGITTNPFKVSSQNILLAISQKTLLFLV